MKEGKRSLGEVVGKLRGFYLAHRRLPSYSEFAKEIGVRSKNAVLKWMHKLEDAGFVKQDSRGRISLGENFAGVPLLGVIEAGFPTGAEEEVLGTLSLDSYLIKNREATYVLTVKGDSMIDAGIREGDMVIVERGVEAKSDDIVIAEIDGAFTMKYYRKRGREVSLEAANKKYKTIFPKNDLKITAVVRAVIRKY
ncbi:MAG TPA: transcriptional repressor LexA [Candidatus Paceibacterota bacterium]